MPRTQVITPEALAGSIREIGAQRCIMSTDFGQVWNPPPAYGMKMFIAMMLGMGLSDEEVELMVKTNPAKLCGLA
jgi:predicted TIM-barrel fold metal-dependent hydrolase